MTIQFIQPVLPVEDSERQRGLPGSCEISGLGRVVAEHQQLKQLLGQRVKR